MLAELASKGKIIIERDTVRLDTFTAQLSELEASALSQLRLTYSKAGLEVPKLDQVLAEVARQTGIGAAAVRKLFQQLRDSGGVLQVSSEFYFAASAINELIAKIKLFAESSSDRMIDVAVFKDIAGVSRKYAIPLLEYLDQRKITARRGDKRLII